MIGSAKCDRKGLDRWRNRLARARGLVADRARSLYASFGRGHCLLQHVHKGLGDGGTEPYPSDRLVGVLVRTGLSGGLNAREGQDVAERASSNAEDFGGDIRVIGHSVRSYVPRTLRVDFTYQRIVVVEFYPETTTINPCSNDGYTRVSLAGVL